MKFTTGHVCLSVRGFIAGPDRGLVGLFKDESGATLTVREAREYLMEELVQGREVLPIGPACEGFDYSGGGCPGHPSEVAP